MEVKVKPSYNGVVLRSQIGRGQPHPPLPLGAGIEWGSPRDIINNQIGYAGDIELSAPLIS